MLVQSLQAIIKVSKLYPLGIRPVCLAILWTQSSAFGYSMGPMLRSSNCSLLALLPLINRVYTRLPLHPALAPMASPPHYKGDTTKFFRDGNDIKVKPKALSIIWGKDNRYWRLPNQDEDPVELLQVCWLEVSGSVPLSSLEKGKDYQVSFDVEMKPDAFGWANSPVYLMVKPGKSGRYVWRKSDLSNKNAGRHHSIPTDEGRVLKFTVKNSDDGANDELLFGMYEIWKGRWKGGMLIHGVKIERC